MKRASFLPALVACAIGGLAAQQPAPSHAPSHPSTRSEQRVPFAVGETLVFDVSWSSYVTAGQATLSVVEKQPASGSTAYHIVADGRPSQILAAIYRLYYKVETLLDASNLLPHRSSAYTEEGRRRQVKTTIFDRPGKKVAYEVGQPATSRREIKVPPLTQDALAALYVLRALALPSGEQLSIPVMNNGELYQAKLTTGARESVTCGLGTVEGMRIDMAVSDAKGADVGGDMAVWLTTGRRQVPVQMKADLPIGTFRLVLREARGLLPAAPHGAM